MKFNYNEIPEGYYDKIADNAGNIRKYWHILKFQRIIDFLPEKAKSILDIGCFAGTFLRLLPEKKFEKQVGVDVLEKQIQYANSMYKTTNREFKYIPDISRLNTLESEFDCVTLIEVIEHLKKEEIAEMFSQVCNLLKPGGLFILSTPNYSSMWPFIEFVLNLLSDVKYEEQHITRFNYFTFKSKLNKIYPNLNSQYKCNFVTTINFLTPFLAAISPRTACKLSASVPHENWHFPFGNLITASFQKL